MLDLSIQRRVLAASGYAELEMFQDAVDELQAVPTEAKEGSAVLGAWLDLYQHWGKWEEAVAVARRLSERQPDESNWLVALAYATRRANGIVSAKIILEEAAVRFPENGTIFYNLACYAAQLGELERAQLLLTTASKIDQEFTRLAATDPDLAPLRKANLVRP